MYVPRSTNEISRTVAATGFPATAHIARLVIALIALLCIEGLALGQSTNSGDIRGTVTDSTGSAIPDVKVTILNVETGVAKEYLTNRAGIYDTVSILPGSYRITFAKDGFSTLVRAGISLEVGAPLTVDAQLGVAGLQQQVEVTAEGTQLKTETAEQATTFQSSTMTELPNVTRSWANMTKILPGVTGSGTAITANGTMPYYSSFLADGASTTLPHSANVDLSIFEAVAEVQINTSTFSAQYGTGAVVFNQISKSGTNQWHGSLYEFLQNNDLNARNFFSPSVPIEKFNNFGGSVGGPIKKDKLFFFFDVEQITNKSLSYRYYTYPTADMLAGNFSNPIFPTIYDPASLSNGARTPFPGNIVPPSEMDPLAVAVQKYFPTPNMPGYVNNLLAPIPSTSPWLKFFGRADYNISDSNRVTMSVTEQNNPAPSLSPLCPVDCFHGDVNPYQADRKSVV